MYILPSVLKPPVFSLMWAEVGVADNTGFNIVCVLRVLTLLRGVGMVEVVEAVVLIEEGEEADMSAGVDLAGSTASRFSKRSLINKNENVAMEI